MWRHGRTVGLQDMGQGREMGAVGSLCRLWVSVLKVSQWCCSHYASLGMETWTFYTKSVLIFTALFNWYFSHMSLRFILLLQVSQNPLFFAPLAEELQPINSFLSACYINKKNINEAPIYHSFLSSSVSYPSLSHSFSNFLPSHRLLVIFRGVDQLKAVTNGLGEPITRPSPMQETENSHQLETVCSHTSHERFI